MYKATLNGHTFISRTANHSTKGSRRGFALDAGGENPVEALKPWERRESIVRRVQSIDLQLMSMGKRDPRREALGQEKYALQNQLRELPKRWTAVPSYESMFVTVAKERLPSHIFKEIYNRANERARRAAAEYEIDPGKSAKECGG